MKKRLKTILIVIGIVILLLSILAISTMSYFETLNESEYNITEVENVSTSITDISQTGATIIIKDTNVIKYTYGEWYKMEKEMDGVWYELPTKIKEYGFDSKGYNVDEKNEVKFDINWEWLYGKLPTGSYRIIKESHHKYIAIPFNIAVTQ